MRSRLATGALASVIAHAIGAAVLGVLPRPETSEPAAPPVGIELVPAPARERAPEIPPGPVPPPADTASRTSAIEARERPPAPRAAEARAPRAAETESSKRPRPRAPEPPAPRAEPSPDGPQGLGMRTRPAGADERAPRGHGSREAEDRLPTPGALARAVVRDPGPPPSDPLAIAPRGGPTAGLEDRTPDELRPSGGGSYESDTSVFTARVAEDGRVAFEDRPAVTMTTPLAFAFDPTDVFMRAVGEDPYAARKRRFLERTRAFRARMARSARSEDLRAAVAGIRDHLAEIWGRRALARERRRRLIFQLWDECAEEGAAEVVAAGRAVRGAIEAFIRRRLPRGSAHGYTASELRALNAERASAARFAPYDDRGGDAGPG